MDQVGYQQLDVWNKAIDFVEAVYELTRAFPDEEKHGLTSQIQRASVSIPSNIAQGYQRKSEGDYARFIATAQGSLAEVETQLILAVRLKFIDRETAKQPRESLREIAEMLVGLKGSSATRYAIGF